MPNTIATNLQRLIDAKENIADAITARGGSVSSTDGFEDFPALIASLPDSGVDTEEYTSFPISVYTKNSQLMDYTIYGNSGGVGDACLNEIPLPHYRPTFTNRGITYVSNEDGTVTANGTADYPNGSSYDVLVNNISPAELSGKTYTMSAADSVTDGVFIILYFYSSSSVEAVPNDVTYKWEGDSVWRKTGSAVVQTRNSNNYYRSMTIRFNDISNIARCQLQIRAFDGTVLDNFVFKPMFFEGEEFQPFDTYGKYRIPITAGSYKYAISIPQPLEASGNDVDELSFSSQKVTYRTTAEPEEVSINAPTIETSPNFAETVIDIGTSVLPSKAELTFRGWHYN